MKKYVFVIKMHFSLQTYWKQHKWSIRNITAAISWKQTIDLSWACRYVCIVHPNGECNQKKRSFILVDILTCKQNDENFSCDFQTKFDFNIDSRKKWNFEMLFGFDFGLCKKLNKPPQKHFHLGLDLESSMYTFYFVRYLYSSVSGRFIFRSQKIR